ncbi:nuclear receptor coactivator 5-like [Haliotis cracherodii]|uniref:nuclear receptor coactivator 5-like n=1 Tax=Haliotis cracherodii TaxID=6455 RepID=UPI0039E95166
MPRSPYRRRRSSSSSSSNSSNSKSRSRNKRNRSRSKSPRHHRGHTSRGQRSKSRESSRQRKNSVSPVPERPISSDDPKYLNARIFVGHLPSDRITREELEKHFLPYGNILDASVHPRGYGFVQFVNEADARNAVEKEQRSLIKGSLVDVKMAAEGRRERVMVRERRRSPPPFADHPASYPREREREPLVRGPPVARDRSPVRDPYDDRYRDPYREPRDPARPPPPPREARDPYYDDPYRRPPPPDPYYDRYRDDPYRRDPYAADPYRDPYRDPYYDPPPQRKPPPAPAECVVVIMTNKLRTYGETIERQVKSLNLITDLVVIPEDRTLSQQIEDISHRGGLFAIVINSQNELHRSLTLNILHGSPQEHRNMPVEDAMSLVGRSFEKYVQTLKEKAAGAAAPAAAAAAVAAPVATPAAGARPPPFLPPSKEVSYLLNLLADNRQLTLEELDKIIMYLRDRRDKMIESERRPVAGGDVGYREPAPSAQLLPEDGLLQQQQQQELQTKILSILNGSGQPTAGGSVGIPQTHMSSHCQPPPVAPASGSGSVNTALINFDNPSVQKALDNLIQSGPNLLRNISAASSTQSAQTASGPHMARDLSGRPGLLNTPGIPRPSYTQQGMAAAPPVRGMPVARPRY